jgi:hypothetical protein
MQPALFLPDQEGSMTDFRQDRSRKFKKPFVERGNPHGGGGRRVANDISEQFETHTGHPLGERSATVNSDQVAGNIAPSKNDPTGIQHTRKGQAQSPRELNINQPEKERQGHR